MPSIAYYLIRAYLGQLKKKRTKVKETIEIRRKLINEVGKKFGLPKKARVFQVSADAVPAEWIKFEGMEPRGTIFYLHGGAYNSGSLHSHRHLVANIAHNSHCDAVHIDYRLAPEHPYPAAVDDAFTAYLWLAKQVDPANIVIAGDSAGGGLALAMMLKLAEIKQPLPKAAVLMAPWVDLSGNSPTIDSVGEKDVILSKDMLSSSAQIYADEADILHNAMVSPIYGNYQGFPPVLIQVGTYDLLLNDAQTIAKKLEDDGVVVQLEVWPKMLHVWQFFTGKMPEAIKAINNIAEFIGKKLTEKTI